MVRRTDSGDNWIVIDSQQDTSNPRSQALFFNLTSSRLSSGFDTDFNATGFQIKTTDNWTWCNDCEVLIGLLESLKHKKVSTYRLER